MSAPLLSSSSPTNGASGAFINTQIQLTFDTGGIGLDPAYVTPNSFLIRDLTSNRLIELSAALDSTRSIVTLTAKSHFKTYQAYKVFALGMDTSSTLAVRDLSGNRLVSTVTITFTTGDQLYTHDPNLVQKTTEDLANEGDLYLPSNLKVISGIFALIKTTPLAWSHNQNAATITFEFTDELDVAGLAYFSIEFEPMLGISNYVADPSTDGWIESYTAPTGTWALDPLDASKVTWTAATTIPRNLYCSITISDELTSAEGTSFAGADFGFNTTIWPQVSSVRVIKREIPAALEGLRDDYLGFLLLKNAIYCNELTGGAGSLTSHSFSVMKYVINQTIVDVLDDKELEKALAAGTRRQLGDLNVSIDSLVGKAAIKHARAQAEAEKSLASLLKDPGVRVGTYPDTPVARLWYGATGKYRNAEFIYYQEDWPLANVHYNRQAKVPPYPWI